MAQRNHIDLPPVPRSSTRVMGAIALLLFGLCPPLVGGEDRTLGTVQLLHMPPQTAACQDYAGPYWRVGPLLHQAFLFKQSHALAGPVSIRYSTSPVVGRAEPKIQVCVTLPEESAKFEGFGEFRRFPSERVAEVHPSETFVNPTRIFSGLLQWASVNGVEPEGAMTEVYYASESGASEQGSFRVRMSIAARPQLPSKSTSNTSTLGNHEQSETSMPTVEPQTLFPPGGTNSQKLENNHTLDAKAQTEAVSTKAPLGGSSLPREVLDQAVTHESIDVNTPLEPVVAQNVKNRFARSGAMNRARTSDGPAANDPSPDPPAVSKNPALEIKPKVAANHGWKDTSAPEPHRVASSDVEQIVHVSSLMRAGEYSKAFEPFDRRSITAPGESMDSKLLALAHLASRLRAASRAVTKSQGAGDQRFVALSSELDRFLDVSKPGIRDAVRLAAFGTFVNDTCLAKVIHESDLMLASMGRQAPDRAAFDTFAELLDALVRCKGEPTGLGK